MRALAIILSGLLFTLVACQKKTKQPAPAIIAASAPSATTLFDHAENYFQSGEYARAIPVYTEYLSGPAANEEMDLALFHLALAYAFTEQTPSELSKNTLRRLIEEFPRSAFRPQAELILTLQAEVEKLKVDISQRDVDVKRLKVELEKLKKIDLQRRPFAPLK